MRTIPAVLLTIAILWSASMANAFDAKRLLKDYEYGLGFKKGDVLTPRQGASPATYDVIDRKVVVLDQSILAPHQYTVVGERANPPRPSDRFVKFQINGHDWDYAR